jgi:choline dehydrogenase-like flavoprotein
MPDCDVLIVGSGPSGTSAAFPLLQSGKSVIMADGGNTPSVLPPEKPALESWPHDDRQWEWKIGRDFYALRHMVTASPKLRVPVHAYVFQDFVKTHRIITENFLAVGSLATGGLSNAWGCGVARLSPGELRVFPFAPEELDEGYAAAAQRMGMSGRADDDLTAFFGVDAWAGPPLPMEALHTHILHNYMRKRDTVAASGFRLGRSRVAVLGEDWEKRLKCHAVGNCLWGCARNAQYASVYDLPELKKFSSFNHATGFIVEEIVRDGETLQARGMLRGTPHTISATCIILAAGVLASTRIALKSLGLRRELPVLSCPTAAFLLWIPRLFGIEAKATFAFGQLSYAIDLGDDMSGYGNTYCTTGIPLSEFMRYVPFARPSSAMLLRGLLSSCLAGNLFLPGHFSTSTVRLQDDGCLLVRGGFSEKLGEVMRRAVAQLRRAYWACGAVLIPASFTVGMPGGDIHCSGTFPMRSQPVLGATSPSGEVHGLAGVFIADGACLPELSEKPHLLTLMANAHKVGRHIAASRDARECRGEA